MRRLVAWLGIFGMGMLLGRLPAHSTGMNSSDEALSLREVTARRQSLVESAREHYERYPDNFLAASRLAVLLSSQREDQLRGEREFGIRLSEPVYAPELQALLRHCSRLAQTKGQPALIHGLVIKTSRQDLRAEASG